MSKCRSSLELFFAIWFVMGNVWSFDSRFGTLQQAPKLQVLCIILLVWNAICYSFPFLLFLLLCCVVPLISTLLGYNMNIGSSSKGASDDQISQLPSWRFKVAHTKVDVNNDSQCSERLIADEPVSEIAIIYASTYIHIIWSLEDKRFMLILLKPNFDRSYFKHLNELFYFICIIYEFIYKV